MSSESTWFFRCSIFRNFWNLTNFWNLNNSIFIRLPKSCDSHVYRELLKKKLESLDLDLSFTNPKQGGININLEDSNCDFSFELGYNQDQDQNLYLKDKPTTLFHFNKNLYALCLCSSKLIIEKLVLGINQETSDPDLSDISTEAHYYDEKYLFENALDPLITKLWAKHRDPIMSFLLTTLASFQTHALDGILAASSKEQLLALDKATRRQLKSIHETQRRLDIVEEIDGDENAENIDVTK